MSNRTPSVYIPVEPDNNGVIAPLIFSVLIHVIIIAFIFYTHQIPHIDVPISIETSVITQEELETIEANILANQAAAAASAMSGQQASGITNQSQDADTIVTQDMLNTDNSVNNINNLEAIERAISEANDRSALNSNKTSDVIDEFDPNIDFGYDPHGYAAREEAFRQAREDFAKQLAEEMEAKQQNEEQRLAQIRADRVAAVEELKRRAAEGNTEPNTASRNNNSVNETASNNADTQSELSFRSSGTATQHSASGNYGYGETGIQSQRSGSSGVDDAAIIAQLERLIKSRWTPPTGSVGQRLVAEITVNDATGVVTSVSVSGANNNSALKNSLITAIQSGPLTPVIGTGKRKLKLVFIAT